MKNFLLTTMFLVLTNGLFSQSIENLLERSTEIYNQALLKTENQDGEYKFCEEDYVNGNELESHSDVNITVNGNNVHYVENYFKEGNDFEALIEGFSSRNFTRYLGPKGKTPYDSVFIYLLNNQVEIPVLQRHNQFSGDKLQSKRVYTDEGLYFDEYPKLKMILTEESIYEYENGVLLRILNSKLDRDTREFKQTDLTEFRYKNNLLDETILYEYDEQISEFLIIGKVKYYYDDSLYYQRDYFSYWGNDDYKLIARKTYEYDTKGRHVFRLHSRTNDEGETWKYYTRDSIIYDEPTLYLEYPNRSIAQKYSNGEWRTPRSKLFKDCGSVPSRTNEITKIDFEARFVDESVVFNFGDAYDKPVTIQLFDVQGNILHSRKYNAAINRINALGLPSGLYIVKVVTKDGFGSRKLVKI